MRAVKSPKSRRVHSYRMFAGQARTLYAARRELPQGDKDAPRQFTQCRAAHELATRPPLLCWLRGAELLLRCQRHQPRELAREGRRVFDRAALGQHGVIIK